MIDKIKKVGGHRFSKYFSIGIFTTLATLLLWNLLIWMASLIGGKEFMNANEDAVFSVTQFVASTSMIYPSYYLNRIFTFKDKEHSDASGLKTIGKAFAIYLTAPLIASLITYLILQVYNFQAVIWTLAGIEIKIGRYFLQGFAIVISVILNYNGQKLFLYKK